MKIEKSKSTHLDEILSRTRVKHPNNIFKKFTQEIYESIKTRHKSSDGVTVQSFEIFMKLSSFISKKIFSTSFSSAHKELSKIQFVSLLESIYTSTLEEFSFFLFKLLDFDKDDIIHKQDVQLLAYHFHYCNNNDYMRGTSFISIQETLNLIVDDFFGINTKMNYDTFLEESKNKNSDIILLFLIYFFNNKPFKDNQIDLYQKKVCKNFLTLRTVDSNADSYQLLQPSLTLVHYLNESQGFCLSEDDDDPLDELNTFEDDFLQAKNQLIFEYPSVNTYFLSPQLNSVTNDFESVAFLSPVLHSKQLNEYDFKNIGTLAYVENIIDANISKDKNTKVNQLLYELDINNSMALYYLIDDYLFVFSIKKVLKHLFIMNRIINIKKSTSKNSQSVKEYIVDVYFIDKQKPNLLTFVFNSPLKMNEFYKLVSKKHRNVFEDYKIKEENIIGKGGFGTVLLSENKAQKAEIIIKLMPQNFKDESQEVTISNLLQKIRHPNIIRIYGVYETLNNIYIVMEKGKDNLKHYIAKNNLTIDTKYELVNQLVKGLYALHSLGIIHRDIKLENVLMSSEEELNIKIIDFGLSQFIGNNEFIEDVAGTLYYFPPEILKKERITQKGDIWSLGVVFYFILLKTFPFGNDIRNEYTPMFDVINNIFYKNVYLIVSENISNKECIIKNVINFCLNRDVNQRADIFLVSSLMKNKTKL